MGLVLDPSDWLESLALIALGLVVFGYNATARLVLTADEVLLKRYWMTVWRVPFKGTRLIEGRGGKPPILPAYLLCSDRTEARYILKVWFDDRAIAEVRSALAG